MIFWKLIAELTNVYANYKILLVEKITVGQQTNIYDCGIYTCYYIAKILKQRVKKPIR
jgi:Ulp1 family protease